MPSTAAVLPPPLLEGDRLDADEFLRRWEAMPELKFAELIDGVVFSSSPLSLDHGTTNRRVAGWLYFYESRTPGTEGGDDVTWVMGPKSVPQPDNFLRILPEFGGQSAQSGNYGSGAPELIVEVSGSSLSRDFGVKKELYRSIGVREYVTVELQARKITWRQLVRGRYRDLAPAEDGLLRSHVFPGLWLDPDALWKGKVLKAVERGVKSAEHAAFVQQLAAKRRK